MDIFSSKPPDFGLSEIKNIVYDNFGLEVEVKILDSDRDQNFYLYDKKQNDRFVLKIFNPAESLDIINMQTNVLDHFQVNRSPTIRSPKIIKALDGQKFTKAIYVLVFPNGTYQILIFLLFWNFWASKVQILPILGKF